MRVKKDREAVNNCMGKGGGGWVISIKTCIKSVLERIIKLNGKCIKRV